MRKLWLSICLVSGTTIGASILVLPLTLCNLGTLPSVFLILFIWFFMYISSLFGVEVNLRAGKGLSLGKLGRFYNSKIASYIGIISFITLIYSLLSAYLYGAASILSSVFIDQFDWNFTFGNIIFLYASLLFFLLMNKIRLILQINKFFVFTVFAIFIVLVSNFLCKIKFNLLLPENGVIQMRSWTEAIPVLSTAFGFQAILHTLTNFCNKDPILIKRSIFWGSFFPAFFYIIWTLSTSSLIYFYNPNDYQRLLSKTAEAGEFIQILAQAGSWSFLKILVKIISIVAIIKSSIGVSLGLLEVWHDLLDNERFSHLKFRKIFSVILTIIPPLLIAIFIPHLFLKALKFGGMFAIIIGTFLPLWLINRPKALKCTAFYTFTKYCLMRFLCLLFGVFVILCQIINMVIY